MFKTVFGKVAAAGVAIALAASAGVAQARDHVNWSVGIAAPGVVVGASNGYPAYGYRPAPVYYAPPPPVYYAPPPRPVYYAPPVVYSPPPYYYGGYRHGHRHGGHGRHGDWR